MKKILALILCLILAFSLISCSSGSDEEMGTDTAGLTSGTTGLFTEGESEKNTDSQTDLTDGSQGETDLPSSDTDGSGSDLTTSTNTPTPPPPVEDTAGEDKTEGTVDEPVNLTLKYDDRYTFADAIENIETLSVTSKVAGTDKADGAVLKKKSNLHRDVGIACGVGTARVTLKNGSVYLVTVTPAPISVFLMIGQSNTEGSTVGGDDPAVCKAARDQSIVCEEGQIYSTYAWSTTGHATYVAGFSSSNKLSVSNAKNFVASSLTSSVSRGGTQLEYPLNSLSAGKRGKSGYDSGLAWKWHELTGEKVWVVNCGAGSTTIQVWQPGQVRYDNCVAIMDNVRATMDAEVAAGHYELKSFAYFWLQGESNSVNNADLLDKAGYLKQFETLHTNLKKDVYLTDKKLEGCGMIMVRAFTTSNPATDTKDTGPRLAQKEAIAATSGVFADVFEACTENDKWITVKGVRDYWNEKYPNSVYPFRVHAQTYTNPTAIATVHTGIHYLQPGYNEIGIVSATNALDYLR